MAAPLARAQESFRPATRVELVEGRWHLNGKPAYAGTACEGLLLNVRMVNATFDDRNPKTRPAGFDADKNTQRFLDKLPEYAAHGVRAITLNLQGGMPGYEGALNSVFEPDGSLRPEGLARVARVIEACDRLGVVVILGYFYQRQDQVLRDEEAVKRAVVEATRWIETRGYTNVVVEIANEYGHGGFDHAAIRDPARCAALVRLARDTAKRTAPRLLVSASGLGDGRLDDPLAAASDFLLPHFNGTPVERIGETLAKLKRHSKPIVCNEDDKTGAEAVRALEACVAARCSWGYMNKETNQYWPFTWKGAADDPLLYARLAELTAAAAK